MTTQKSGVIQAVIAYGMWGFFPLYWYFLRHLSAGEIFANRIVWSFILLGLLTTTRHGWKEVFYAVKTPKVILILLATTLLLCVNWLLYIWSVTHHHVIEASMGYYINPLINMLLGAVFLSERLRNAQYIAIVFAFIGVLILTLAYGRLPLIALTLAVTFGLYSLLRKIVPIGSQAALFVETVLVFVPAAIYLLFLGQNNTLIFGSFSEILLLIGGGIITIIPLICLANGLKALSLSTIGFIQYLSPTLQFLCGLLFFKEAFGISQLLSFAFIWLGLVIYTAEMWHHHRHNPR